MKVTRKIRFRHEAHFFTITEVINSKSQTKEMISFQLEIEEKHGTFSGQKVWIPTLIDRVQLVVQ